MADTKISALTAATTLADTDELVIASAGASKKITGANLKASIPTGAAGAVVLLHTLTLGSAGSFDQASISGSYKDLRVVMVLRSSHSATNDGVRLRFNNDSGANYMTQTLEASSSSASTYQSAGAAQVGLLACRASTSAANMFTHYKVDILGYASTTWVKAVIADITDVAGVGSGNTIRCIQGSCWNSTAAINRVTVIPTGSATFVTGSQVRIYGIS